MQIREINAPNLKHCTVLTADEISENYDYRFLVGSVEAEIIDSNATTAEDLAKDFRALSSAPGIPNVQPNAVADAIRTVKELYTKGANIGEIEMAEDKLNILQAELGITEKPMPLESSQEGLYVHGRRKHDVTPVKPWEAPAHREEWLNEGTGFSKAVYGI